jgi:hypothetical protein
MHIFLHTVQMYHIRRRAHLLLYRGPAKIPTEGKEKYSK